MVSIISSSENFRLTVEFNEPDHYNQFIEFLSSTLQFSGIWQTDYETELNSVVSAITSEVGGLINSNTLLYLFMYRLIDFNDINIYVIYIKKKM